MIKVGREMLVIAQTSSTICLTGAEPLQRLHVNTFANNTNEFFTTTTTTPKIRVSTMSPQTGAANKFRSIGKPKFPYHRTPRILIEQREREREREKKNASLFSVQCRGHRSRAFAALIFFFSFQKSFSTKKEDKKSEENQPSGKISLSLVLSRSLFLA